MEKASCTSEVVEFSVPSSNGLGFLNLAVDSFCSGIGQLIARRITDAFSVSFEYLGDLGGFRYGLLVHTLKPELEILYCIRERVASKVAWQSSVCLKAMLTCKFNFWMAWKTSSRLAVRIASFLKTV